MKDFNITIKQPNGCDITVSTDMIEEDVIRTRFGLDAKDQCKEEEVGVYIYGRTGSKTW